MFTRNEIIEILRELKPILAERYKVSRIGLFGPCQGIPVMRQARTAI